MIGLIPSRSRATIIVKAAPRVGQTHGELVCCAGIDSEGKWVRLYPVAFRTLEDAQKFSRWDVVEYEWQLPKGDKRIESRRIVHKSVSIVGELKPAHRENTIAKFVVPSLVAEANAGRSLALIRPSNPVFHYEKKPRIEFEEERQRFVDWHRQESEGLFGFMSKELVPYEPAPYRFKYTYQTQDGVREGTCQDWEIEATFLKWRERYGEEEALQQMKRRFGQEYPEKGFVLAMGTHKAYGNWLINGIVRLDLGAEDRLQGSLF